MWFNERERAILIMRMRGNVQGADVKKLKNYQVCSSSFFSSTTVNEPDTVQIGTRGSARLEDLAHGRHGGCNICMQWWCHGFRVLDYQSLTFSSPCQLRTLIVLGYRASATQVYRPF